MGLNVSPTIWQTYINTILNSLQSRKYCEAIMDNLLLFTPSKKAHMDKLENFLKALRKNERMKISPKKCQLFRTELQYMENTMFIKKRRVCVKPLCSRLEVIQKVNAPTTAKQYKSFAGMLNFVSIFCPELQRLLLCKAIGILVSFSFYISSRVICTYYLFCIEPTLHSSSGLLVFATLGSINFLAHQ